MQNVSLQMTKALNRREEVEIDSIILHSSWSYIGVKTFFFLISLLWRIPMKVKSVKPDVILFSSMVTAGVLPFMVTKPKVPKVTINHGQDVTLPVAIYQWYLKFVFKYLDGVISVSSATRKASILRGMDPEKGVVLPNGYEEKEYENLPEKEDALKILHETYLNNHEGRKVLLTVGRQVKRKGHQWFIENVIPKIESDFVYLIVGSGPEFENIKEARNHSEFKDRIVLTGKISKKLLTFCYSASDLFIMPNIPVPGDMEGFGIVILEANRAGVPAIASDLEGIKDVIKQGVNGYRIEQGDATEFANKIDDVLNNDLGAFSIRAKEYVIETFNWNAVVEKYIHYLRSIYE